MISKRLVRTTFALSGLALAAAATAYWVSRPPLPFDEAFEQSGQDEAAWRLVVNYSADGLADQQPFVACFRHREPPKSRVISGSWLRWWEPTGMEWEEVGGPGTIAEFHHSCSIGTDGNWCCECSMFSIAQNATGVDLTIKLSKRGDPVAEETISLPFPETATGREGKISYFARWEEISDAEL